MGFLIYRSQDVYHIKRELNLLAVCTSLYLPSYLPFLSHSPLHLSIPLSLYPISPLYLPSLSSLLSPLLLITFRITNTTAGPLVCYSDNICNLRKPAAKIPRTFPRVYVYPNRVFFYAALLFRSSVDLRMAVRPTHERCAGKFGQFQEFVGVC